MEAIMKRQIFFAGFFLTFSAALSYYVNSSFLKLLVGENRVGLVYAVAAVLAILIFTVHYLTRNFDLLKPSRFFGLILAGSYLGLSFIGGPVWLLLVFFILIYVSVISLGLLLDLYLENLSRDQETGRIRGGYLTIINAAILLAPLVSGSTLGGSTSSVGGFQSVYLLCLAFTLPLLYQLFFKLKEARLPATAITLYDKLLDKNLRQILKFDFLLNLFYFVMAIYLPIYLHGAIGFSWEKIGLILTIMLIPFILIDYPLGWLADKRWGEKEILTVGLIITALATLPIAWLTSTNWLVWAGLLFATRVGASAWEAMKETYLFKRVNAGDIGVIGLSRLTAPASYLVGALITFFLLKIIPLPHLFTILALIILASVGAGRKLVDMR